MREEMKDLIDDNPIEEDGDSDSSSDGDGSGDDGSDGGGRAARKRSREDDDLDDALEDDDYDLIEENLGVKVSRVSDGPVRVMGGDSCRGERGGVGSQVKNAL